MKHPEALRLAELAESFARSFERLPDELTGDGPIGLAVSGGGDSVALLLAAAAWARTSGRELLAISIDHGYRKSAREEIAYVGALCERLGVGHAAEKWQEPPVQFGQASARDERYRLLAHCLFHAGGKLLVTGHTEDDQAETVLQRAASGSTIVGLASMRTVAELPVWPQGRGLTLFRPFLGVSRAELRRTLTANGVKWYDDPGNTNLAFDRIKLRRLMEVQPTLRGHGLKLLGAAQKMRRHQDRAVLSLLNHVSVGPGGVITIPVPDWSAASKSVRMRVLQMCFAAAAGSDRLARRGSLTLYAEHLSRGDTRPAALGGALNWRSDDQIYVARDPGEVSGTFSLEPGGASFWDGRLHISVSARADAAQFGVLKPETRLPDPLRAALRALPAPARKSQLARLDRDGTVIGLPGLVPEWGISVRDCVAERLEHQCRLLKSDHAMRRFVQSESFSRTSGPMLRFRLIIGRYAR